jgi:hypothetical protein
LALGIPREDPLTLVIDADAKLDRAMKALTWESAEDDLRELMVELARATADAVNVAERVRTEQRPRVNMVMTTSSTCQCTCSKSGTTSCAAYRVRDLALAGLSWSTPFRESLCVAGRSRIITLAQGAAAVAAP